MSAEEKMKSDVKEDSNNNRVITISLLCVIAVILVPRPKSPDIYSGNLKSSCCRNQYIFAKTLA